MSVDIKHVSGRVLFSLETDSVLVALEAAVRAGADLRGANLWGANLGGANLWGANLGGANLWGKKVVAQRCVGPIGSRADYLICLYLEDGTEQVRTGCWSGGMAAFEVRVAETYPLGHQHRTEYDAAITFLRATAPTAAVVAPKGAA